MTITRPVSQDPPGSAFLRAIICLAHGGGELGAAEVADQHCQRSPQVAAFLRAGGFGRQRERYQQRIKTAVAAGSMGGSHWLDDVDPFAIGREGFQILQSASIFGRLSKDCRRIPFRTRSPREYGAGAGGAWAGEGTPRPVMQTLVDQLRQEVYEAVCIFVASREALRFGAETMLRAIVAEAPSKFIDGQLLDPTITASGARPAAITNGAAQITSTGSSAAQIVADLTALIEAIESPADSLRWIMRPVTYYTVVAKLAGAGYTTPPGFLFNIPTVLGGTSPPQITLVDASSIAVSYDDVLLLDLSTNVALEMDTAPTQSAITGSGAALTSMFQAGAAAIKASLNVAWQPAAMNGGSPNQPSGVSFMPVSY